MKHLVFTYGTLKRGFHNNKTWLPNAKFILSTKTKEAGYKMHPEKGVFPIVGYGDNHIMGEVFEIDEKTLRELDKLEAEGFFYNRRKIHVEGIEEGVWIYLVTDKNLIIDYPILNFLVKTTGNVQEWLDIEEINLDKE